MLCQENKYTSQLRKIVSRTGMQHSDLFDAVQTHNIMFEVEAICDSVMLEFIRWVDVVKSDSSIRWQVK